MGNSNLLFRTLKYVQSLLLNVSKDDKLLLGRATILQIIFLVGASSYHTRTQRGSKNWTPYECHNWDDLRSDEVRDDSNKPRMQFNWKEKSDIQVAGMLAYYIYTTGKHPFGPKMFRMMNLHNDNPVGLENLNDPVIKDLLSQMLSRDLDKRPYVEQALHHPYFLSCEEQIKFVETVANESEIKNFKKCPSVVGMKLNTKALALLPKDWKACINPDDLDTFCEGGRGAASYDGSMYTDCFRLIRNVRQHWYNKPRRPLKAMGQAKSIEEYFLQLFPHLPLVVYQVIRKHSDWRERDALKKYFPKIDRRAESSDD